MLKRNRNIKQCSTLKEVILFKCSKERIKPENQ